MLDNETKRRIDTARDILVGKVPDPKSQVEQITIALIYKFMDDMDKEAVELGGKPSFFVGDYERYAWSKIFDPRIGGYEMLNLYAEAITKLNQNPNLPQLFRDIFKNAYLPYRDPETLKLFLKTINEFSYDHSERLGDAFEYLLSVLGSQGDAGQFRTPRHIIDFMVQVVNPQKHETILDPACGTAGFLISSYKHILKENCKKIPGDLLTPEERKKLLTNFKGYDISPDMVRLSLVNMYLHGFVQPQIIEYDTLTSEDRWNEYADVILANPPFMTPKGGIKPHKRFSVQSNRSEVLFVDYIAEHLTPTGRAAVIVPEGIIFQSATAYKTLRKMLVENYLYAVVSLPAGVFNPYSGVKTSILLMDKQLAKKTDSILFVKIENDGFDLGAQRREIDKNDLPDALNVIKDFVTAQRNGKPETFVDSEKPCGALLVKKEKLAENGDFNIIGDRYRETLDYRNAKWKYVKIGDLFDSGRGRVISKNDIQQNQGEYPVYSSQTTDNGILGYINSYDFEGEYLTWTTDGANAGKVFYRKGKFNCTNVCGTLKLKKEYEGKVDLKFIAPILDKVTYKYVVKVGNPKLMNKEMERIEIPLPPIEVQREIVAEIEGYQKLIDGCRQVVDSWKPDIIGYLDDELKKYLNENPERRPELVEGWPMVELGDLEKQGKITFLRGQGISKKDITDTGKNKCIHYGEIYTLYQPIIKEVISRTNCEGKILSKKGDVLVPSTTTADALGIAVGRALNEDGVILGGDINIIRTENKYILSDYLAYLICNSSVKKQLATFAKGTNILHLSNNDIRNIQIPLPPIEVQQEIVAKIEAERKVIDGCRELIKIYEEKIKRVIDKVWGE